MKSTTGTRKRTKRRNSKSVIITKGTPIITKTPNTKNAPKTTKAIESPKNIVATNEIPKPTIPLKNSVNIVTKDSMNRLGIKNMNEGMS
jgi:hypothetical protein